MPFFGAAAGRSNRNRQDDPIIQYRQSKQDDVGGWYTPSAIAAAVAGPRNNTQEDSRGDNEEEPKKRQPPKGKGSSGRSSGVGGGLWGKIRKNPKPTNGNAAAIITTRDPPEGVVSPSLEQVHTADSWNTKHSFSHNKKSAKYAQRYAIYHEFGHENPIEQITVVEDTKPGQDGPQPTAPDRIVIKIRASTVTLDDCIIRRGLDYQLTDPVCLPAIPGRDFVGKVVAIGDQVTEFKIGDRVGGLLKCGGNARYVDVGQTSLVPIPKKIDAAEAVCLISVYAAASQAICFATNKNDLPSALETLEHKNILIVGGLDGVGQAIIQLCRIAKAIKVSVPAPDRRHAYVRSVLKATPLPDDSSEWGPRVASSMDYVFDAVCDAGMDPSLRALREEGRCICVGNAGLLGEDMGWFGVPVSKRLEQLRLSTFVNNFAYFDLWESCRQDPAGYKMTVKALFEYWTAGKIKPEIAKRVGLDEVGLSMHKLEQGQVRASIVCLPWKKPARKRKSQSLVK